MRASAEYGLSFIGRGDTQIRWRFPIAFQLVFVAFLDSPLLSACA